MTLYEFKQQNGITQEIEFSDRLVTCPAPWNWMIAFEEVVYDENIQVVIVGCFQDKRRAIWTSIGVDQLPPSVTQRIDDHLSLIGLGENSTDYIYPSKDDGFFILKDGKRVPQYNEMGKFFKDELKIKNDDTYSCIYENGFYRDLSRTELTNLVEVFTKGFASSSQHDSFKKKVNALCFYPKKDFQPPEGLVNLKNGVLDVKEKSLLPHSPSFNFRYRLNHNFDPEARAPRFLEFLDFVFDHNLELVKLVGEIMGYTLIGGDPFAHKAFIFYGDGRNGKSTLLDVIKELLGEHSVSSVPMGRLSEPFSVVRMDGKLANIVEETPSLISSEAFKAIVGGGTVSAARKHMDEYDLKVKARLFFACNDYPHFKDSSKGLQQRLVIIPFKRYIKAEERDTEIKPKLFSEMSGILNFALKGYERFIAQGGKFTQVKEVDDSVDEYMAETDSVISWAQEYIQLTMDASDKVYTTTLYDSYKNFCKEGGYQACSNGIFGKRLKRYIASVTKDELNPEDLFGKSNSRRYVMMVKLINNPNPFYG